MSYLDVEAGTCRSCGSPVLWARHHKTGRVSPLEEAEGGGFVVADVGGTFRPAVEDDEGPRYGSHFATCPQAGDWRRP